MNTPQEVYQLTCESAALLGSRMGTEYTTVLWSELFFTREAAAKWAVEFCKKNKCPKDAIFSAALLSVRNEVDATRYIFSLSKKTVKI